MGKALLSVDWDYFFTMPGAQERYTVPGTEHQAPLFMLYDWGHREAPMFMGSDIWMVRDATFRANGVARPDVNEEWRTFWEDFRIKPGATLYFGESHAWAAEPLVERGITTVWNFDAHHDCAYGEGSMTRAMEGQIDCGNWLAWYWEREPEIHVRYPRWRAHNPEECRPEIPGVKAGFGVPDQDDMPEFDRVFICRSGAWTPSWCDHKYAEFVASCPAKKRVDLGQALGWSSDPREYNEEAVEAYAEQLRESRREFQKSRQEKQSA